MGTMTKKIDYIKTKQGAKQKRSDRLVWLNNKIAEYTDELAEVGEQIERDTRSLDTLTKLADTKRTLQAQADEYARQTVENSGEAAKASMALMYKTQDEIRAVEEEERQAYYDKR